MNNSCVSGEGLESPEKSDTEGYHRTYDPVVTSLHHDVQAETGGLLLYASTKNESRSRRPTDLALALLSLLGLVISATVSQIGGSVDAGFADFVTSIPNLLDPLWKVLFWAPGTACHWRGTWRWAVSRRWWWQSSPPRSSPATHGT
jgi:hypothetical protein